MLQKAVSLVKFAHSALIVYLTFTLYEIDKSVPATLLAIEILLAFCLELLKSKEQRSWKNPFLSLALVYALRPSELGFLRYLFLAKIFYVAKQLSEVSENILTGNFKPLRLLKVAFDFSRLTMVFYMFLGVFIVVYKYWAYLWTDPEKVLSTHQILYYLMITSSSVGYGDFTPKNEIQIYFMLTFIPILIIGFGVYFGQAVACFDELMAILRENVQSASSSGLVPEGIFGKEASQNLTSYIQHTQSKNATISHDEHSLANSWIAVATKNSSVHQPLLLELLDAEDSQEYKLLVASKLKRQFYPAGWTILARGDIDEHVFMVEDGEVEAGKRTLTHGKTFNLKGFLNRENSEESFVTKTIVSVWAVSARDLEHIGRKSVNLQNKINKKLSTMSE